MLVEVQCDEFKKNNEPRGPIRFHTGLNVVLGNEVGSNSVGKSTFLMILDFVFGGTDYVDKCADVMREVGPQKICFAFEFEGKRYCFSRSTDEQKLVHKCDENYQPLEGEKPISLNEYRKFLADKYDLDAEGLSWRGTVSRFIRVYKRDTLDEELPLKAAKGESAQDAIKSYMRLFDRYAPVEHLIKVATAAKDEEDVFRRAMTLEHIRAAKDEKERDANAERIARLAEEKEALADRNDRGLLDLDSVTASRVAFLTDRLQATHRELASERRKLDTVQKEMANNKGGFKRTFSELERFFPAEDFKSLVEIEKFHKELTKILADEFAEAKSNLEETCRYLEEEISGYQSELAEIKNVPNVSKATLEEYARLDREITALRQANAGFEKKQELKENVVVAERSRDEVIKDELLAIETSINPEMRELTYRIVDDEKRMPPVLRLESLSKYSFTTPNDGGTGSQHRSVITFDLANMAVTKLPLVIHDSVLMKNIERTALARIFEIYATERDVGKQVFIAFDAIDAFSEKTQRLLHENEVLYLSPEGNELFGWAWNKEEEEKEEDGDE